MRFPTKRCREQKSRCERTFKTKATVEKTDTHRRSFGRSLSVRYIPSKAAQKMEKEENGLCLMLAVLF